MTELGALLDCTSSSDDDDDLLVPEEQVPFMLVTGRWRHDNELRADLAKRFGDSDLQMIMDDIDALAHKPLTYQMAHEAFFHNHLLGLAYLELFGHRGKYYELHVGHKPRRGDGAVPLPYVAHNDAKVCCPNSSGLLQPAINHAIDHEQPLVDLGCGEAAYLQRAPGDLVAVGYELNANPLLMETIRRNARAFELHRGTFYFVPLSFTLATIPEGSYTLFSWHPGSHRCPKIHDDAKVTAFFAAVRFDNLQEVGLGLKATSERTNIYSNHELETLPRGSTRPQEDDFEALLCAFPFDRYYDERRCRSLTAGCPEKGIERAQWTLDHVKWRFIHAYLGANASQTSTQRLLGCGIPQKECRTRIVTSMLAKRIQQEDDSI